jgi:hypothetical protein
VPEEEAAEREDKVPEVVKNVGLPGAAEQELGVEQEQEQPQEGAGGGGIAVVKARVVPKETGVPKERPGPQSAEEIDEKKKALGVDQPPGTAGEPGETGPGERVFPGPSEPRKSIISTEAGSSVEEEEAEHRRESLPGYYHGKEIKELAYVRIGLFPFCFFLLACLGAYQRLCVCVCV